MKRFAFAVLTLGFTLACIVLGGELLSRLLGRAPFAQPAVGQETCMVPDPELGWVHAVGTFYGSGAPATFLEDGSRSTGSDAPGLDASVVWLVGGSFTEGYGVPDAVTFAARLQRRLPERRVVNLGTAGYGTLQSALILERHLDRGDAFPAVHHDAVVYGFIDHHLARNLAVASWRRSLLEGARGFHRRIRVPWARCDHRDQLELMPPVGWPLDTLSRLSALAALLTDSYVEIETRGRGSQALCVGVLLMERMHLRAQQAGASFVVADLLGTPGLTRTLGRELAARGIAFADCSPWPPEARLFDRTGHPRPMLHARYAACIGRHLDGQRPLR